jgi:hypothetical protein
MSIEMVDLSESIEFNYLGTNIKKTQIILCDTKRNYKDYINSLKYRYNKKNPYLPNYVISKEGELFKVINPEHYSKFMGEKDIDSNAIIIALENLGWFKKNPLEECYVNWLGDIYKKEVFEKKWRDEFFWDYYSNEQIDTLIKTIEELCNNFKIPKKTLGHNVRQDGVENFRGIVSKSNFNFKYKDVNPSFDFELIKKKLEYDE